MSKEWFDTGFDGHDKVLAENFRGPSRFWLKVMETKDIIFVDDNPVNIWEYNPQLNGKWTNWFTDPRSADPDDTTVEDCIGTAFKPYYVGYFTIVNCTPWKDRNGKESKFDLTFYCAKPSTMKKLKATKEDCDGLKNKLIKVRRTDSKQAAAGDMFNVVKPVEDMGKLFPKLMYQGKLLVDHIEEAKKDETKANILRKTFNWGSDDLEEFTSVPTFNYMELLKPKSKEELRRLLKGAKVGENPRFGESSTTSTEDSVPF